MDRLGEIFGKFILIILMAISIDFVTAWGYQFFWNHIVLNIWQLFTTVDVINTMQISYWVFFAIAVGLGLIYNPPTTENTDDPAEAFALILGKTLTKLLTIGIVMLVASLVF